MKLTRDLEEKALELHKKAIVVDFHCDVVLATLPDSAYQIGSAKKRRLLERSSEGHVDLPRLIEGGVDCQVFSHFVEPIYNAVAPSRMLQVMGYSLSEIEKTDKMQVVTDPKRVYSNHAKRISVIIGFEGGEALGGDLRRLDIFHRLGLRRLTLTWNNRNEIADGVRWQRSKSGLTEFGVEVVEECNRLGILVDVSHITDHGFWDTLEASKDPVIASHSNCRAICDSMRNLTDDMIKALVEKGGVMGVNYVPFFLGNLDFAKVRRGDLEERAKLATISVENVVDHIDHIVEIAGSTDNIGLGSDFDGVASMAQGLEEVTT